VSRLFGEHHHLIDAKGRLFIPSRLLKVLGDPFFATVSKAKCINIYTLEEWEKLEKKFDGMEEDDEMAYRRKFYSNAQDCNPDSQGRVLIKQNLRDYAGLKKNVVIAGAGKYAEIWDADEWERGKS
jgi:MraZ protein